MKTEGHVHARNALLNYLSQHTKFTSTEFKKAQCLSAQFKFRHLTLYGFHFLDKLIGLPYTAFRRNESITHSPAKDCALELKTISNL